MLFKKELSGIEPLEYHKPTGEGAKSRKYSSTAKTISLTKSGDVLVVDFYETDDKKLAMRFFSDGKKYLTVSEWPAKEWTQQNPRVRLDNYAFAIEAEIKTVKDFLKPDYCRYYSAGLMEDVDNFISGIRDEARKKAASNKEELRKKHFAMFPDLPDNLAEYCEENIFDHTFIFISKIDGNGKRKGRCGHCGKRFPVERSARSGQPTVCPKCGRAAAYRGDWLTGTVEEMEKICIAHKVNGQLLLRWTNVFRTFEAPEFRRKYEFYDYAFNLHLHTERGNELYFYKWMKPAYSYWYEWYRGKIGDCCWDSSYIYTDNLNEVFGDKYYNVNLKETLAGRKIQIPFCRLLTNLKNVPEAEYLMKLNMPVLAAAADSLHSAFNVKPSFTGVLGVSGQMKELYSSCNVTLAEHRIIKAHGGYVSEDDLKRFRKLSIPGHESDKVCGLLEKMTLKKLISYFEKQKAAYPKKRTEYLLMKYRDYLDMSEALGVDLGRKSVKFPKSCIEAHGQILPRFNAVRNELEIKKLQKEDAASAELLRALYSSIRLSEFEKDGFRIALPQKRTDLIAEGQSLNHCVGNELYYKNHIAGTKMIFFIRKTDEPQRPFFTMEIDMSGFRICQLYGFGDCSAPKDVRRFAEDFLRRLKPAAAERKAS